MREIKQGRAQGDSVRAQEDSGRFNKRDSGKFSENSGRFNEGDSPRESTGRFCES